MVRDPRLVRAFRALPLVAGVAGVLAGGALLIFRLSPIWIGLSVLAAGIAALTVAQWWERRGALTAWIPFLLGAAILLGGLGLWRELREDERTDLARRLDQQERAAEREVGQVLDTMEDAVTGLAGSRTAMREWQDVVRQIDAAFDADPSLVAVELLTSGERVVTVRTRPGHPTVGVPDGRRRIELWQAAERARKRGEPQIVGPFPGPRGDVLLRVVAPVSSPTGAGAVLSGVFAADQAFAGLRGAVSPLFGLRVEADGVNLYQEGAAATGEALRRETLDVEGETDWTVEVAPTEELIAQERTGYAEIALAIAVGLALLLALSTWFGERAARRARAFEDAVRARTSELEAARAQAQEANEAKDRFLAMLGHELRNPLASINTALEVLRRQEGLDPQAEMRMRAIVQRQMGHLARLVDDLLDVSRIERGKLPLKLEPVDLARLVREVAEAERSRVEEAGLSFQVEVAPEPLWIDGDATRLTQVIYNLLSNAVKFTERGGSIRLAVRPDAQAGGAADIALVEVADSGAGIDGEDLERVFQPFAQTELGIERSTGLGLGLPIVRGLVEAHDGVIRATSPGRGHGTTLEIRIPLRDAPQPVGAERAIATEAATRQGRRILVVDDHADSREALRDLLEVFGHEVEVAKDGDEGLRMASGNHLDVVICDIGLPGELDGYAVAERLRTEAETASLRLVALTGWGDEGSVRRALDAGFDRHLTKPVDPELLREVLSEE